MNFRNTLILVGIFLVYSAPAAAAFSEQDLARARAGTAKYHSVAAAEADGYEYIGFCEEGEGCHWEKASLVNDTIINPETPEDLVYVPTSDGGWRLVAVEYLVPVGLSPFEPEGFEGDDDIWYFEAEGPGFWEMTAWVWYHNPDGMFAKRNPRIED